MNLRHLVRGAISRINKDIVIDLFRSTGYVTQADGTQAPKMEHLFGMAQVQACTGKELQVVNGMGYQGVFRSVYLCGNWCGVVRADQKGGDVLSFAQEPNRDKQDWKVVTVLETWPQWCKVVVCLQN